MGALMGLALGLVKAVLFGSWGGAGFVTFYSYEHIKPYFEGYFVKQLYVDVRQRRPSSC